MHINTMNHLEEDLQIEDPTVEAHHRMILQEEDLLTIHHQTDHTTVTITMHCLRMMAGKQFSSSIMVMIPSTVIRVKLALMRTDQVRPLTKCLWNQ